jgi:Protein phosphatase 2C
VAVVSDGAGSADRAADGARIVSHEICGALSGFLSDSSGSRQGKGGKRGRFASARRTDRIEGQGVGLRDVHRVGESQRRRASSVRVESRIAAEKEIVERPC